MLVHGIAQVFDEIGLRAVGNGREQIMLGTPSNDRRNAHQSLRLRGQAGQPCEQDLLKRRRDGSPTIP